MLSNGAADWIRTAKYALLTYVRPAYSFIASQILVPASIARSWRTPPRANRQRNQSPMFRSATSSAFAPEGLASRWCEPLRTSCCITRRRTKYSSSNTSTRFSWKRGRSAEEVPSHHHPELRRPQECLLRRPTHTGSPNGHDITCENH